MIRVFGLIILCFTAFSVSGQFSTNYTPAPILDTIPQPILQELKQKLERDKASVEDPKSQVGSFLRSLYEKRYEYLIKTFNDDLFIIDNEFTPYLQSILDEIYRANPKLPKDGKVYAMRSSSPNAVSFGDGTFGFTLGLLARMESDAEVAFVLCHELAHYYQQHSQKDLKELARLNYDKELKKKIDAARKSEYGQYSKMKEVFKGLGFSITHHNRGHEYEADQEGFVYFANTRFNPKASIRLMEILDSVKVPRYTRNIDFKAHFDNKSYAFKPSWAEYTKSTTWYAPAKEEDSLKTHPDCQKRIVMLKLQLQSLGADTAGDDNLPSSRIAYLRKKSEFELVESEFHLKDYSSALFRALLLAEQYPRNIYLQAMIGKCLFTLYTYQKNHQLGKVLPLPDPRFPENYDRYLTFMHKLRLGELGAIAYYYMTSRPEASFDDEEFIYALWLCSRLEISKMSPDKVKEEYTARWPQGRYLKQMR
jgi:hypothetical protein